MEKKPTKKIHQKTLPVFCETCDKRIWRIKKYWEIDGKAYCSDECVVEAFPRVKLRAETYEERLLKEGYTRQEAYDSERLRRGKTTEASIITRITAEKTNPNRYVRKK